MLFHILAQDNEDALQVRLDNRSDHVAWLRTLGERVKMAGPLLQDDGETMKGSSLVIESDSLEEMKAEIAHDPYAKAGLFQSVTVTPFKWVLGKPD